ncbi:hypothetical protein P0W64_16675 [Tsukamurella sp. 8F]|uniref:hypothetical protein n=1 Tax=unclassified Tsukamurella TaxID=2633480 RepID=UPI0023B9F9B6|nr:MULTISPECIES: hypothetical protein [unclassified Tsukamurella]MDF0532012.1 hypothetical protein [Tsukamurella sp. 8J]MDF0588417.1 hypothetical protein [Tsukamurella sp. 8F]
MCQSYDVSTIQVADEAFVAAAPARVAAALAHPARWRKWFPDLTLEVTEDRGELGLRWRVSGDVVGTSEMWIEPLLDGSLLHYFLHAEPNSPLTPGQAAAQTRDRRVAGHSAMFDVKFAAEEGRRLGEPAAAAQAPPPLSDGATGGAPRHSNREAKQ